MSRYKIPLLVGVAIGSIVALLSGGSFLEWTLPGGLPVGNALVVAALCSLAGAAMALSREGTFARYFAVASLIAAAAWLPVSISLAGNLALNFSGSRGQAWIWFSVATVALVLTALAGATIDHLIRRRSQARLH